MIEFKVRGVKNQKTDTFLYYPKAKTGAIKLEDLCDLISTKTTLTRTDIHAGLCALEEVIARHLANGDSVTLTNLGTFSPRVKSNTRDEIKKLTLRDIRGMRVGYRTSNAIRTGLLTAKFKKVK